MTNAASASSSIVRLAPDDRKRECTSVPIAKESFWATRTSLVMVLGLYVLIVCFVAAVLYAAVEAYEPNRRPASSLKRVIVAVAVAAILGHLAR